MNILRCISYETPSFIFLEGTVISTVVTKKKHDYLTNSLVPAKICSMQINHNHYEFLDFDLEQT